MATNTPSEKKICKNLGCSNTSAPDRTECNYCRTKRYKRNKPFSYKYSKLKFRAKERGIPFDLTLDEFVKFAQSSGLMENLGKTADSFTIDRKKNYLGYTYDNLQVLPLSDNASKGTKSLEDWLGIGQPIDHNEKPPF